MLLNDKKKIVYAIELLMIAASLITFLIPLSHFTYTGNDMKSRYGIFMDGLFDVSEPGFYIDNSVAEAGTEGVVESAATDLRFGSYNVSMKYIASNSGNTYTCESDWNTMPVTVGRTEAGLVRNESSGEPMVISLNSGLNVGGYRVKFNYCGDGYIYVYGLDIQETNWWKFYILMVIVFISIIVNVGMIIGKSEKFSLRGDVVLVLILTVFSSLPLFDPYLMTGHDMGFHLERIEALAENFRNGQIPSRISADWLNGKGYATSIFYGDLFLVIPAVMRILGSTLQMAYKTYMALINLATASVSLLCFRKIFAMNMFDTTRSENSSGILHGSKVAPIIATAIFTLSPYRLVCLYTRAAVGEYTAIVFYPLVFWGLMRVYEGKDKARYKALPLIIGISGIINSHVLTGVIVTAFCIGFALINFKKTFNKNVLAQLVFSVIAVLLLNLWFIVPFVQVMTDGIGVMELGQNGRFRSNGTYLWQMLSLFPRTGISLSTEEIRGEARTMEMVVTIGVGLIALVIYAVMRGYGLFKKSIADRIFVLLLITLFMASPYFPWDAIKRISGVTNSLVTNIQFPFRLLSIAVMCVALLTGLMIKMWPDNIQNYSSIFNVMIVMICVMSASFYFTNRATADDYTIILDDFNEGGIMGAEYLPSGIAEDYETGHNVPYSDSEIVGSWKREDGKVYVDVTNNTPDISQVNVPFIYYRGYRAKDVTSGLTMPVIKNDSGFVAVNVDSGYSGEICVFYKEPVLWRICELISLLTVIILIMLFYKEQKKMHG